jgi:hypothetical protein
MRSDKRMMALALLRKLYKVAGGNMMEWRAVDLIVHTPEHVDALQYAVDEHWIERSPDRHSVRVTSQGRNILWQGR